MRGRNQDKQRRAMFAKGTTNAQYRNFLKKASPFADADKDGVRNIDDCRPFDRKRQDDEINQRVAAYEKKLIKKYKQGHPYVNFDNPDDDDALANTFLDEISERVADLRRELKYEADAQTAAEMKYEPPIDDAELKRNLRGFKHKQK